MPDPRWKTRQDRAIATKASLIAAMRRLYGEHLYEAVDIRKICAEVKVSTGSYFNIWNSKADGWREAMACEPPTDSPLTRAAPDLLASLKELWGSGVLQQGTKGQYDPDFQLELDRAFTAIRKADPGFATAGASNASCNPAFD